MPLLVALAGICCWHILVEGDVVIAIDQTRRNDRLRTAHHGGIRRAAATANATDFTGRIDQHAAAAIDQKWRQHITLQQHRIAIARRHRTVPATDRQQLATLHVDRRFSACGKGEQSDHTQEHSRAKPTQDPFHTTPPLLDAMRRV